MKTGIKTDAQDQKVIIENLHKVRLCHLFIPQISQENLKNTRKTLKVLQKTAGDKENLVGRLINEKDIKLAQ
jgi:hypothetical protein